MQRRCGGAADYVAPDQFRTCYSHLCGKVLDAYATLHSLGVIHADVHPRNLLAAETARSELSTMVCLAWTMTATSLPLRAAA